MIPSALTIAAGTSSGRRSAASETKCAPSAKSACDGARGLQREPRLADPAGAGEREQPDRLRPAAARRSRRRPARDRSCGWAAPATCGHERGRHWRPRPRLDRRSAVVSTGDESSAECLRTSSCSSRSGCPGSMPSSSTNRRARGLEGRQRVGLPSAAIQRQHLQLHQALLEGMRDDQRLQLAQQLAVAAQLEVELDPLDDRGQPLLLQPRALAVEQAVRAHSPERLAAPDTKRLLDPLAGAPRLTVRARPPRPVERPLPAVDIALARLQLQQIAARLTDQPAAVGARLGQRLAQPRDVHLQAVARPRGRLLAPQLIDQPVDGHDATAHQRQHREQRPRPLTRPAPPAGHPPTPRPDRATRSETRRSCRPSERPPRPYVACAPTLRPRGWPPVGAPLVAGWRPARGCSTTAPPEPRRPPCTTTASLSLSPKRASPTCRTPPPTTSRPRRRVAGAPWRSAGPRSPPLGQPARSPSPRTTPPPRRRRRPMRSTAIASRPRRVSRSRSPTRSAGRAAPASEPGCSNQSPARQPPPRPAWPPAGRAPFDVDARGPEPRLARSMSVALRARNDVLAARVSRGPRGRSISVEPRRSRANLDRRHQPSAGPSAVTAVPAPGPLARAPGSVTHDRARLVRRAAHPIAVDNESIKRNEQQ